MEELTLNPGFLPMLAALLVLALPRSVRSPVIVAAALGAFWLLLEHEFGAAATRNLMGLPVVPLRLDELNRIFGIPLLTALVALGIYSGARRNRYEDAAILLLAGSAVSALFVGDLIISFVATLSIAGLAAAWVVFASPLEGANRAGARLLIWHGLEGLLLLVGVAFHLSSGANATQVERLDVTTFGGAFIFAALMIRIGAPMAHVWLKDAIAHASPTGAAAISSFTTMLGVYALARCFPSEPLLIWVGAAMVLLGAIYVAAEDDLRRAAAYGLTMQTGLCVALVGIGTPLALAAAEANAFATILAFLALQLTLGGVLERHGSACVSELPGIGRTMPISSFFLIGCGLAVSAAPGFALFAAHSASLEAAKQWDLRWLWVIIWAAPAMSFTAFLLRPALAAFTPTREVSPIREAPFSMVLGSALALFLCLSVGLAPSWLFGLMPSEISFEPFVIDRVGPQFQLLGAAGLAFLALRVARVTPTERQVRLLDIDALYRGPLADAGRWAGVLALRVYGAWQSWTRRVSGAAGRSLEALARACDRPYAQAGTAAATFFCLGALLLMMFLVR